MSKYKEIVKKAFPLLTISPLAYTQAQLVTKFKLMNVSMSRPTMSNLSNESPRVGNPTWKLAAEVFRAILQEEAGLVYNETKKIFEKDHSIEIKTNKSPKPIPPSETMVRFFKKGRLQIHDKVRFLNHAQQEILDIGVSLRTFTSYFLHRADYEFKEPIENLLAKGINFKCFVLDPKAAVTKLYFEDRKEDNMLQVIEKTIENLTVLSNEFKEKGHKGTLQVYTYNHIPNHYIGLIDGDKPNGRLIVSPYIYGVPRSKAPVFELTKQNDSNLFQHYMTSVKRTLDTSKRII